MHDLPGCRAERAEFTDEDELVIRPQRVRSQALPHGERRTMIAFADIPGSQVVLDRDSIPGDFLLQ
jgi:hypothetical protein